MNTAYRHGWDSVALHALRKLSTDYGDVPWFGEAARLLNGGLTTEEYERIVREKYGVFENDAQTYVLMAYVLRGDRESASRFLRERRGRIVAQDAKDPALIRWELGRAERLAERGP
jgi:hypothetical protein